jgi:hypothetical protein
MEASAVRESTSKGQFLHCQQQHRTYYHPPICQKLPNKIHVSAETAELLEADGKASWLIPRDDSILMNGKPIPSFFLHIMRGARANAETALGARPLTIFLDNKTERLVEWNARVLGGFLRSILARRNVAIKEGPLEMASAGWQSTLKVGAVLDEVKEVITLPRFDARVARHQATISRPKLDVEVAKQLKNLVSVIAEMYR